MTIDPTSSGAGATPTSDPQPATGTAAVGATPQKPAVTLEEALAQLEALKHAHENTEGELKRHRSKLSAYEKAELDARNAQLSEVDKATERATKAEERIKQYQQELVKSQIKYAAKDKGIQIDPDIIASYLHAKLELDEGGMPKNLDPLLDELIKSNPAIARKPDGTPAASAAQSAPGGQQAPLLPPMAGRSSIGRPTVAPPGRIPRLTDEGMFKQ